MPSQIDAALRHWRQTHGKTQGEVAKARSACEPMGTAMSSSEPKVARIPNLGRIIAAARELQVDGHYINGTIFHAMADEIEALDAVVAVLAVAAQGQDLPGGQAPWFLKTINDAIKRHVDRQQEAASA